MMRARFQALLFGAVFVAFGSSPSTAAPPPPRPDPGSDLHILYGATPVGGDDAAVLVFVHGLRGHAADWWVGNDMYDLAHGAGYRTAFVNLSRDLERNDAGVVENAAVLVDAIPRIAGRFHTSKMYVIAHSKGAVDAQAAFVQPAVSFLVKAVFMISPPNHGSELADWAFGPGRGVARELGLLTPGIFSLQTDNMALFRRTADAVGARAGVPYFTLAGTTFLGNPLTRVTGQILAALTGGEVNDGFVTESSTKLPASYAIDLGEVDGNHFGTNDGALAFPRIHAQIQLLEGRRELTRIATGGFGDRQNSFAWSMAWFKGRLYVGTGRAFLCVTAATADARTGSHLFRPLAPDLVCAPTPKDLPLAAEIWRYTPATGRWERVYRSPEDVPVEFDALGRPTKHTARDIAFRGMATFEEPGGTEALYVSGVSAGSMFGNQPPWDASPRGFPPPRMLRSVDGVHWTAIPQRPGTFLGDIGVSRPGTVQVEGFRSMASFAGRLFVTATDFRGVGFLLASANPAAGNDAWSQVSPSADEFPIWTLYPWNGWLYLTTGDRQSQKGYGVFKTRALGPGPYRFVPVVTDGAFQLEPFRSPDALSLQEFRGKLYVGTDRPTELIRIRRDDSWELVVGGPRVGPDGRLIRPLSGLLTGFGNLFNGHFWRMASYGGRLFLGTWDWSVGLRTLPALGGLFTHEYGTDFYSTRDGRYWKVVTKKGFGDDLNYGVRSLQSTPAGLFVGTANPWYGLQVFHATSASLGNLDAFANPPEAEAPAAGASSPASPEPLEAVSSELLGSVITLSWEPAARAAAYQVYRSRPVPILEVLPGDFTMEVPGTSERGNVAQIRAGAADRICGSGPSVGACDLARAIERDLTVYGPWERIGTVRERWFVDELTLEPDQQAHYFVVAVDEGGRPSRPSNVVGAPSAAAPATFALLEEALRRAAGAGEIGDVASVERLGEALQRARSALGEGDAEGSSQWLTRLARDIQAGRRDREIATTTDPGIDPDCADDLVLLVRSLARHVLLVGRGLLPPGSLLG